MLHFTPEQKKIMKEIVLGSKLKKSINNLNKKIIKKYVKINEYKNNKNKIINLTELRNSNEKLYELRRKNGFMKIMIKDSIKELKTKKEDNNHLKNKLNYFKKDFKNYKIKTLKRVKSLENLYINLKNFEQDCKIFHKRKTKISITIKSNPKDYNKNFEKKYNNNINTHSHLLGEEIKKLSGSLSKIKNPNNIEIENLKEKKELLNKEINNLLLINESLKKEIYDINQKNKIEEKNVNDQKNSFQQIIKDSEKKNFKIKEISNNLKKELRIKENLIKEEKKKFNDLKELLKGRKKENKKLNEKIEELQKKFEIMQKKLYKNDNDNIFSEDVEEIQTLNNIDKNGNDTFNNKIQKNKLNKFDNISEIMNEKKDVKEEVKLEQLKKGEIKEEIKKEIEEKIKKKIKEEGKKGVKEKVKEEIKEVMKEKIKKEKEEEKEETKEEIKEKMKKEVKEGLKEEIKEEIKKEIKEVIKEELKEEVTEEINDKIKEELEEKEENNKNEINKNENKGNININNNENMVILVEEKKSELGINESIKYIKEIFCLDDILDPNDIRLLKKVFKNLIKIKREEDLLNSINGKKFETFIIILSLNKFPKYIDYLINNSIYNIPISIIFNKNNIEIIEKIDEKYKKYFSDKFYNYLGISSSIDNLISKTKNFLIYYDNQIKKINLGETQNPSDYKDCYSFEYIDNENKLIFPYLYNQIMQSSKINFDEIKDTNRYLLEKYGKIVKLKKLVIPLLSMENIPYNIIAKFWGRIYTLNCPFYKNLNNDLMKLNNKDYNTYVQLIYKGLKEFEYNGNDLLYRGTNISDKEMDILINFYNNIKINENVNEFHPSYLIYSRAYLSFSKNKNKSLSFIGNIPNTKKILFLLKNNSENKLLSNANLYNISVFQNEEEILFFPFSSFIIKKIEEKENIYYIDLIYLGIYENKIKENIEKINEGTLDQIIINSNFGNEVIQSGIIPNIIEIKIETFTKIEKKFINNIIENNYILNKSDEKEKEKDELKNGIICTYNKQEEEIYILGDFSKSEKEYSEENEEFYIEAKKNINEKNIEIYINDKKIPFTYKYKSNEIGIIKIKFIFKNSLTSTFHMFSECSALSFIDLSSLNITKVINISGMFEGCSSLKSIDLSSFNTNNVKYMQNIFCECSSLKSINLSSFNTIKTINMNAMFKGCSELEILDLSNFNTSNVDDMSEMFNKCQKLKEIKGIYLFDTSNVINMEKMFNECKELESIDVSNFDTFNVKTMKNMFNQCNKLKEIKGIKNLNTINVTNMSSLFKNCSELEYLDLSNFNTVNIILMQEMFSDCYKLKEIKGN